jgi:hypothetical protein
MWNERKYVMSRLTWTRLAASILIGALITPLVSGAVAGHSSPRSVPREHAADLGATLGADGAFRGTAGVKGAIDARAWTLVSNLAAGEPPRFAPATNSVSPSAAGPWSALGSNGAGDGALNGYVDALAVSGTDLYVGGLFTDAAGIPEADYVAKWNGSVWSALGSNGSGDGALNAAVWAFAVHDGDLYIGGYFTDAAGIPEADHVANWNGSAWSALGSNGSGNGALNSVVWVFALSGTDLYVGGQFTNAAGIHEADGIARWNGAAWSALGSDGSGNGALHQPNAVNALAVYGTNLYVGGQFTNAAGIQAADYVARWNGSAWSSLGSRGSGDGVLNDMVRALAVSGSNLYVGGYFYNVAGIAEADGIARWNGSAWFALGSNGAGNGALNHFVSSLAVSATGLYVGGGFFNAASIPAADRIAKWNGNAWSALSGSGNGVLNQSVLTLAVSGSDLYVSGAFTNAAGIPEADRIAKWTAPVVRKPDGRVRLGSGQYVGNNVDNTTGVDPKRSGSAAPGHTLTFGISIQNDGTSADRFTVKATGTAVSGYSLKFFRGATEITAAVVAGTYQTWLLAPGAAYLITARVTVKSAAAVGSQVTRLVALTSVANSTRIDAVKFVAKHA